MRIFTILLNFKIKLLSLLFLIVFCFHSTAEGAIRYWTGAVSTDWNVAGNWYSNIKPAPEDDVVIGVDGITLYSNRLPIINSSVTIRNFTFESKYTNMVLTVNGNLTVTNSLLQVHGTSLVLENYLQGTGTITTTDITIGDGTLPGNAGRDYKTSLNSSGVTIDAVNINLKPVSIGSKYTDAWFNLNSGVLSLSGSIITLNLANSWAYFTVKSGAHLILKGANSISLIGGSGRLNYIDFQLGSTVEYSGTTTQTVYTDIVSNLTPPAIDYSNIIFSGAGQKNVAAGNIMVSNNWASSGGKIDLSTNNPVVNFNGTTQSLSDAGSDAANGVYFKNVTFSNSGIKTIASGKFSVATDGFLTMAGTSTLAAGGNLYLKSDASGSANVKEIPAGCVISGDVNVESWFTGGNINFRNTRMVSPPIKDVSTPSNSVYQQLKKYMVITGPGGASNGFDPGNASQPNAVTLTRYVEKNTSAQTQFASVPSIKDGIVPLIQPGEGFFLFFRGNRDGYTPETSFTSNKVNPNPFATPTSFAVTYTGVLSQGDIPLTLSKTLTLDNAFDGLNVIGNPYASTIDFLKLFNNNSTIIENYYSLPKPDKTGTISYSLATNTVTNPGIFATNANAKAAYIQAGQAFYVKKKDANTSSVPSTTYPSFFKENIKIVSSSTVPARLLNIPSEKGLLAKTSMNLTPLVSTTEKPWPVLRINLQDNVNTDEAAVLFKAGYQKEYEGSDVPYFSGSTVSLSTLTSDGKSLAINLMPDLKDVSEVKLNINASASGLLKLNFTDFAATDGYLVFLKDALYPDTLVNVKNNPSYSFIVDKTNAGSLGANRFTLMFEREPETIIWKDFTAKKEEKRANLFWETNSEYRNDYFDLERSADGKSFIKIGQVKAVGTSSKSTIYTFVDNSPIMGINNYRLKQVNADGKMTFSKTESLYFESLLSEKTTGFIIYPNPAKDHVSIQFNNAYQSVQLNILDMTGKIVKTSKMNSVSTYDSVNIDIASLGSGMYIFECIDFKTQKSINRFKVFKD